MMIDMQPNLGKSLQAHFPCFLESSAVWIHFRYHDLRFVVSRSSVAIGFMERENELKRANYPTISEKGEKWSWFRMWMALPKPLSHSKMLRETQQDDVLKTEIKSVWARFLHLACQGRTIRPSALPPPVSHATGQPQAYVRNHTNQIIENSVLFCYSWH